MILARNIKGNIAVRNLVGAYTTTFTGALKSQAGCNNGSVSVFRVMLQMLATVSAVLKIPCLNYS